MRRGPRSSATAPPIGWAFGACTSRWCTSTSTDFCGKCGCRACARTSDDEFRTMNDEATVTRPPVTRRTTDVVPMLTVVAHPNPERVPSELHLESTIEVSRISPSFIRRTDGQTLPLADRYLSR